VAAEVLDEGTHARTPLAEAMENDHRRAGVAWDQAGGDEVGEPLVARGPRAGDDDPVAGIEEATIVGSDAALDSPFMGDPFIGPGERFGGAADPLGPGSVPCPGIDGHLGVGSRAVDRGGGRLGGGKAR
jgi:hypothetical protein